MFIDRIKINIKSGNGGQGAVSFRREKYVAAGGPDGGNGGKGGSIIFEATNSLVTLLDFRYKRKFSAENGDPGGRKKCSGKAGEDLIIKVPVGTIIKENKSGKIMADMSKDGQIKTIAFGGKGGKGNYNFATSRMQAPKYAQSGLEGKQYEIILELKLLADVGIIGFPNVGKSTLLSMVTNAKPKIANYHFTTLSPNLGVVRTNWGDEFVLADIPGLIEGASKGIGLGHHFLRHVERTKLFIHVVDGSGEEMNPLESIEKINDELKLYKEDLILRPQIIAVNKMDMPEAEKNYLEIKEKYELLGTKVFPISAITNSGLNELMDEVRDILKNYPEDIVFQEEFEEYDDIEIIMETFTIEIEEIDEVRIFIIKGQGVGRMLGFTNLDTERGFAFFQNYLRKNKIIDALEEKGIEEGDIVRLYDLEFEYLK